MSLSILLKIGMLKAWGVLGGLLVGWAFFGEKVAFSEMRICL